MKKSLWLGVVAALALPATAAASVAHPTNSAEALAAAQSAAVPSAAGEQYLMTVPSAQLTDAQRAQLGAALLHGNIVETNSPSNVPAPSSTGVAGVTASLTRSQRSRLRAHAAGYGKCFGAEQSEYDWHAATGGNIGSVKVGVGGWCAGPGNQAIVAVFNWNFPRPWAWGPYCNDNGTEQHGPDPAGGWVGSNSRWAHGIHVSYFGVAYPWGCAHLETLKAAIRIAYNGYYDYYDDWGF